MPLGKERCVVGEGNRFNFLSQPGHTATPDASQNFAIAELLLASSGSKFPPHQFPAGNTVLEDLSNSGKWEAEVLGNVRAGERPVGASEASDDVAKWVCR